MTLVASTASLTELTAEVRPAVRARVDWATTAQLVAEARGVRRRLRRGPG